MRKLVKTTAIFAGLWGGYWAAASWGTGLAVDHLISRSKADGFEVAVAQRSSGGFPLNGQQILQDVHLTNAKAGMALHIPAIRLAASLVSPGTASVTLPAQHIKFKSANQIFGLKLSDSSRASISTNLDPALQLQSLQVNSAPFELRTDRKAAFSGERLDFKVLQSDHDPKTYDVTLSVDRLAPAGPIRRSLRLPASWPQALDLAQLLATVTFERPLDRNSTPGNRPQPRMIDLEHARISWGGVQLDLSGKVTVDRKGIPTGDATIAAKNWREVLDILEHAKIINDKLKTQLTGMLGGFSKRGTDGAERLSIDLTFRDGQTRIGFIPVGDAPKIYLQ